MRSTLRVLAIPAVAAAVLMPLYAGSPDVFALVQKSCVGCHSATVNPAMWILRHCAQRGHSKTIARSGKSRRETQARADAAPGLPRPAPKPLPQSRAGWSLSSRGRIARSAGTSASPPTGSIAPNTTTPPRSSRYRHSSGGQFPADTAAHGFDNISDALNLSPGLLENYVDAAERAVRTALFGPERMKPAAVHYSAPVRINDSRGSSSLPKDLFHYDETGLSTRHSAHFVHRFPVDAEYSFRLVLNGHRPNQSEPVHPALFIDGKLIQEFEVDATDLEGQIVECRTRVTAGEHLLSETYLRNYSGLPPKYQGPEPSKRPPEPLINPRGQLTAKDIETLRKYGTKIKTDAVETRVDNRFEAIDVGGPFNQATGPSSESIRRIYVCGHGSGKHTDACARTILTSFVTRAFRRPAAARKWKSISDTSRLPVSREIPLKRESPPHCRRCWCRRTSCIALSATSRRRPDARRRRWARMSWLLSSPISCGAARRTRSCFAPPAKELYGSPRY